MSIRVVNEDRQLLGPDLLSPVTEDEEHGVDDVGFSRTVWADYGGEGLVEGSKGSLTGIRLEVFINNVGDNKSGQGVMVWPLFVPLQ